MFKINKKKTLNIILFLSIFTLLVAFFIQYILGHKPCNLCIIERIPYILAIVLISFNLMFNIYQKIIFFLLGVIFIAAAAISFYHFGIEQGFFDESLVCDLNPNFEDISREELLKSLKLETISCKDVTFKVLGLSLATINTILSLILSAINIKIFLNYEKN
jgi:disulfide bond formation protein DsbB